MQRSTRNSVKSEECDIVDQCSEEDVYIHEDPLGKSTSDQFVTLKLRESGNFMKFQLDTGAECNVVPVEM